MPSTYSPLLRAELQASGENETTWGDKTNANFTDVFEKAIAGLATVSMPDANYTLTVNSGTPDEARNAIIVLTGSLTAQRNCIVPSLSKTYIVKNSTTGGQSVTVKTAGGTGVTVVNGQTAIVYCDSTNVYDAASRTSDGEITSTKISGSDYSWRFNGTMAVGRAQGLAAGYGVFAADGTLGSVYHGYANGVFIGQIQAVSSAYRMVSATVPIALTIAGLDHFTLTHNASTTKGDVVLDGTMTAGGFVTNGGITAVAVTASNGGFVGISKNNVTTGLGYTPVAQGASTPSITMTYNAGQNATRLAVGGTDYGRIVTDSMNDIFIKSAGATGRFEMASDTIGTSGTAAALTIRAANYANFDAVGYAPRIGFYLGSGLGGTVTVSGTDTNEMQFIMTNFPGTGIANLWVKSITCSTINGLTPASDIRLKNVIGPIEGAVAKVKALTGFTYTFNREAYNIGAIESGTPEDKVYHGLSAQDMQTVVSDSVYHAPFDRDMQNQKLSKSGENYLAADYARLVPLLVEAIKELENRVAQLENPIT